jgi:hypothetical protein
VAKDRAARYAEPLTVEALRATFRHGTGHARRACGEHPEPVQAHEGVIGMATGETGFGDVMFDLISVQYHSLKAGHDYGHYVRDAENRGYSDIADFFKQVMEQDSRRAAKCHEFLEKLAHQEDTGKS